MTQKGTRNYNSITNRRRNCDSCKENYLDLADMTMPSRLNILELKMNYEGARGKQPDLDKFDIELRCSGLCRKLRNQGCLWITCV